jgi:cephalosporin-C deacetylase-like acetyl esterase
LEQFAVRFQAAGYAVLVYDNRNFGASEGTPRREVNPTKQSEDYHDAFNFLASRSDVDPRRVFFWGSSFSGGNVIVAAALDKRIIGCIAQVPFVSGEVASAGMEDQLLATFADRAAITASGQDHRTYVPQFANSREEALSSRAKAITPSVDEFEFYEIANARTHWENRLTLGTLFQVAKYEPRAYIHRITPTPLLVIVAENDTSIPPASQIAAFESAKHPKTLHIMRGQSHHSCYKDEGFEESVTVQIQFLNKTLDSHKEP